jgi:hypothetical protein
MRFTATVLLTTALMVPSSALAQTKRFAAKILIQVDQVLDAHAWALLTPADRTRLQQFGIQVIESQKVLRSPAAPFAGYWVQIGTHRYAIDRDGLVVVDEAVGTLHNVKVFAQVADAHAFVVIPKLEFVQQGQTPEPALLKIKQKPHSKMNMESSVSSGSCFRAKCAPTGSPAANAKACCLDYDGPLGDDNAYNRSGGPDCLAKGVRNYTLSTCARWSFPVPPGVALKRYRTLACLNESAYPWNAYIQPGGNPPTCYRNHKYRNCQNMDEDDLSLAPAAVSVSFGKSVTLKLRNNTPGNSTCIRITGKPGSPKLALASSSGALVADGRCRGYRADHWSDTSKKHVEDLTVRFIAGPAPANECDVTYHVLASGGDQSADITVVAHNDQCGGVWAGAVRYSYQESGSGSGLVSDNYTEEQTWTVIGPTAENPEIYDATWTVAARGSGQMWSDPCRKRMIKKTATGSRKVQLRLYQNTIAPYFELSSLTGAFVSTGHGHHDEPPAITAQVIDTVPSTNCGSVTTTETEDIEQWSFLIKLDTPPGNDIADSRDMTQSDLTAQRALWAYSNVAHTVKKTGKLTWSLHRVH